MNSIKPQRKEVEICYNSHIREPKHPAKSWNEIQSQSTRRLRLNKSTHVGWKTFLCNINNARSELKSWCKRTTQRLVGNLWHFKRLIMRCRFAVIMCMEDKLWCWFAEQEGIAFTTPEKDFYRSTLQWSSKSPWKISRKRRKTCVLNALTLLLSDFNHIPISCCWRF